MKDNLEQFISDNKSQFDDLEVDPQLWNGIENKIKKNNANYTWIWKVAVLLLLGVTLTLLLERQFSLYEKETVESVNMPKELKEVERHYSTIILTKRNEIAQIIEEKNLTDVALLEDLEALDLMYEQLKENLNKNQNDERVINAMIRNLQLRVEILNKQLEILQKLKRKEDYEIIS